jgi:tRNA(Ile2) C34 agmatinyltransferase TiaS
MLIEILQSILVALAVFAYGAIMYQSGRQSVKVGTPSASHNRQTMPVCPSCPTVVKLPGGGYRCDVCGYHWPVKPA